MLTRLENSKVQLNLYRGRVEGVTNSKRQILLKAKGISKSFPGVRANDNIDFDLFEGEVHAIVGENGAGKSTLIKIISGILSPDSGELQIKGEKIGLFLPHILRESGISTVYQEVGLVPDRSVAENIYLGQEVAFTNFLGKLDRKKMNSMAEEVLIKLNTKLSPKKNARTLSAPETEILGIARMLEWRNSDIFIMDEPTSALSQEKTEMLFRITKMLTKKGKGIIYISHRLGEIEQIADRVTVLRDGKKIITLDKSEFNIPQIIRYMVGRELNKEFPDKKAEIGDVALLLKNICVDGVLKNINLYVRKGEVLGIGGLVGSGRSSLLKTIMGLLQASDGEIYYEGEKVKIESPKKAVELGIGLIPEERLRQGIHKNLSVRENVILAGVGLKNCDLSSFSGWLNSSKMDKVTSHYIKLLNIKVSSIFELISSLSGGNQQKVIISKWLCTQSKLLLFDEPTKGIDVAAKKEIYNIICDLKQKGVAIIMISSEMEELLGMSDRIIVMNNGSISGEFNCEEATQEKILEKALPIG